MRQLPLVVLALKFHSDRLEALESPQSRAFNSAPLCDAAETVTYSYGVEMVKARYTFGLLN